ncbi:hypothetical protein [Phenylobacterium deserti]|uniref:Uncharacterized protein n=1 Tax=Phenylobacterium deserti TaxID=1914756 RepID=A0A328AW19_9CAUL|nr:hypothetical protein [Phenylobacterium deserti]RAK57764.1 hypothetical protein DJ018_07540 [Phenylobacterium deserti]
MRATQVGALGFAAALLAAGPAATQDGHNAWLWLTLTQSSLSPGLDRTDVALVTRVTNKGGAFFFILERREMVTRGRANTVKHQWVDGRTCAALSEVVQSASDLPPARINPPNSPPNRITFHVATTTLSGPSGSSWMDRVSRTDLMGPNYAWWEKSKARLKDCWQNEPPMVGGKPPESALGTDRAARALLH